MFAATAASLASSSASSSSSSLDSCSSALGVRPSWLYFRFFFLGFLVFWRSAGGFLGRGSGLPKLGTAGAT